jgi:hypothetical protein
MKISTIVGFLKTSTSNLRAEDLEDAELKSLLMRENSFQSNDQKIKDKKEESNYDILYNM